LRTAKNDQIALDSDDTCHTDRPRLEEDGRRRLAGLRETGEILRQCKPG